MPICGNGSTAPLKRGRRMKPASIHKGCGTACSHAVAHRGNRSCYGSPVRSCVGSAMVESWRKLRVGDRIRLVRLPSEFNQPGYYLHRETRQVYKRLIERRRPLRVYKIDEWGLPWIRCRFRRKDGSWEYNSLA